MGGYSGAKNKMTNIKPLKITPIEIMWRILVNSPEQAFKKNKKNINLGNIDISVILSWLNLNQLLTLEQIEDLRHKIDENINQLTKEEADLFYINSLMNIFFNVIINLPKKEKQNALGVGIDTVINYLHNNRLLPKEECDQLCSLFAENIEKMVKNCPVKQKQKNLSDC